MLLLTVDFLTQMPFCLLEMTELDSSYLCWYFYMSACDGCWG